MGRKIVAAVALMLLSNIAWASCEVDREVRFAGMNWMSNRVLVDIQRHVIEEGFGCKTAIETGETLPMLSAIVRGDIDVMSEVWTNSVSEVFSKGEAAGKVKALGNVYEGASEGWWIPKYVADKYPELTSVSDLGKFKQHFSDPEEPGKGRFYTCPTGWACEVTNANLFKAFDLNNDFVLYSPGTGAALDAAVTSAIKRKKNIVFYYWTPTPIAGRYDLVKLKMPPFDAEGHRCNSNSECDKPYAGDFPNAAIETAVNTAFAEKAPNLVAFLERVSIPSQVISELLSWADEHQAESDEVAAYFIKQYPTVWQAWLSEEMAKKLAAK